MYNFTTYLFILNAFASPNPFTLAYFSRFKRVEGFHNQLLMPNFLACNMVCHMQVFHIRWIKYNVFLSLRCGVTVIETAAVFQYWLITVIWLTQHLK